MKRLVDGKPSSPATSPLRLVRTPEAITTLRQKKSGHNWASPDHPLALFSYQTLSKADYDVFLATYLTTKEVSGLTGLVSHDHIESFVP